MFSNMSGPDPTQLVTWLSRRSGFDATTSDSADSGQWLYCLKGTARGDRQAVWSGVGGDGLIAVVDFEGSVRRRSGSSRGLYEGWGRITRLARPVEVDAVRRHPVLSHTFSSAVQNCRAIDAETGAAISECAGGLPSAPDLTVLQPDWREAGGE